MGLCSTYLSLICAFVTYRFIIQTIIPESHPNMEENLEKEVKKEIQQKLTEVRQKKQKKSTEIRMKKQVKALEQTIQDYNQRVQRFLDSAAKKKGQLISIFKNT